MTVRLAVQRELAAESASTELNLQLVVAITFQNVGSCIPSSDGSPIAPNLPRFLPED